jgi:hypothetical protein
LTFAAEGGNSSSSPQKDVAITCQASQQRSQRRPIHEFEPGNMFGTKVETIKQLLQMAPIPMFDRLRTLTKRCAPGRRRKTISMVRFRLAG